MHVYDLVMLALLALLAWGGARRGLLRELAGVAAFALGLLLAYRLAGPLGHRLTGLWPSLPSTAARAVAFIAVVAVVGLIVDLAAMALTRTIAHVPVVGGLNRLGGLLAGLALGLLAVWLLTVCLLLLPPRLVSFAGGVRGSETARLVRAAPPRWSDGLRDRLRGI